VTRADFQVSKLTLLHPWFKLLSGREKFLLVVLAISERITNMSKSSKLLHSSCIKMSKCVIFSVRIWLEEKQ